MLAMLKRWLPVCAVLLFVGCNDSSSRTGTVAGGKDGGGEAVNDKKPSDTPDAKTKDSSAATEDKSADASTVSTANAPGEEWNDHTQHLPFILGYENGMAAAKAANKPAMLFVTTTWCGWCTKLADESFTDPEIKKLLDNFVLVIVDGDTEQKALQTLGADEGFPHVIFQSSSGTKLGEQVGYAPAPEFKQVVQDALDKSGKA